MSERYELIDAEKDTMTENGERKYPVTQMCGWLEVSTSGFYEWRGRPASATACRRERLAAAVRRIFEDSDETYGHRRIHAQLAREGQRATPELVRAVMRDLGLVAIGDPSAFSELARHACQAVTMVQNPLLLQNMEVNAPSSCNTSQPYPRLFVRYLPSFSAQSKLSELLPCRNWSTGFAVAALANSIDAPISAAAHATLARMRLLIIIVSSGSNC